MEAENAVFSYILDAVEHDSEIEKCKLHIISPHQHPARCFNTKDKLAKLKSASLYLSFS